MATDDQLAAAEQERDRWKGRANQLARQGQDVADFRTKAINLCRKKAAEWEARVPNSEDETFKYHYRTRASAATELAQLLETLQ